MKAFWLLSLFIPVKVLIKNKVFLLKVIIFFSFGQTNFFFPPLYFNFLNCTQLFESVSVSIQ